MNLIPISLPTKGRLYIFSDKKMIKDINESRITVHDKSKAIYDIVYSDSFNSLADEIFALTNTKRKICIITDSNVEKLYADQVKKSIENIASKVTIYSFPAGEENKTLDTVKNIYVHLIQEGFDRKDLIVALGGGVVGDVSGYTASTYLRGIDFVQIPTTLLAQSDSSVGGKTGVDFDGYKNMVGAFHMPSLVYMNLSVLNTLDDRQYFAGFAEVMKSALIKDATFYEWLIEAMYEICEKEYDALRTMVMNSCDIKRQIVEKDPTEKGDRALLNLGHTLGHAIEKSKGFSLLHGECVALGCVAAAYISWQHDLLSMEEFYEIRDMFVPFNLPISVEDIDPNEIVKLTKSDKKMAAGHIKFILLKKIGKAVIDETVTDDDMLKALNELLWNEED